MAHPDLMTKEFKTMLEVYDSKSSIPIIKLQYGLLWKTKKESFLYASDKNATFVIRENLLIVQMAEEYIGQTQQAKWDRQEGEWGVLFLDENDFIPLHDLGLNREIGFYRVSEFPDVENHAELV